MKQLIATYNIQELGSKCEFTEGQKNKVEGMLICNGVLFDL